MANTREIDEINSNILSAYQEGITYPLIRDIKISSGLSSVKDSITSAKYNPDIVLIDFQIKNEKLDYELISLKSEEVNNDLEQLRKLNKEKETSLKEHAIKVNNNSTWNAIKNVASYFGFAASTLTGLTAFSNPIICTTLVASGTVGLVNRALSDTGAWEKIAGYFTESKETQEKVSRQVDNTLSLTSAGLGIGSLAGGMYLGAGAVLSSVSSKIKGISTCASTLMNAVSSYGSSRAKGQVYQSSGIITHLESEQQYLKNEITTTTAEIKDTAEKNSTIISKVYSMLENLIESLKNITKRRR